MVLVEPVTGEVRIHVMADSWWTSFPAILNAIKEQYKARGQRHSLAENSVGAHLRRTGI